MAVTYEYVGKTGGAKVTSVPINFTSPSGTGVHNVTTVQVPEGKEYRVTLIVATTDASGTNMNSLPDLIFSGVEKGKIFSGACGASIVSQGSTGIQVRRNSTSNAYAPSFTGTVYYWPTS